MRFLGLTIGYTKRDRPLTAGQKCAALIAIAVAWFMMTGCTDTARSDKPELMRVELAELHSDNVRMLAANAKRTIELYDAAVTQKDAVLIDKLKKCLVEDANTIKTTQASLNSSSLSNEVDRSALAKLKQVQDELATRLHGTAK